MDVYVELILGSATIMPGPDTDGCGGRGGGDVATNHCCINHVSANQTES